MFRKGLEGERTALGGSQVPAAQRLHPAAASFPRSNHYRLLWRIRIAGAVSLNSTQPESTT